LCFSWAKLDRLTGLREKLTDVANGSSRQGLTGLDVAKGNNKRMRSISFAIDDKLRQEVILPST
jgi:hypothetical protein